MIERQCASERKVVRTRTIPLLSRDGFQHNAMEKIGDALFYYRKEDLRIRPQNIPEGESDDWGILELLGSGKGILFSMKDGQFIKEFIKQTYTRFFDERDIYLFSDGISFYEVKTKSITPTFLRSFSQPTTSWRSWWRAILP